MSDSDSQAVDETSTVSLDKLAETSPVAITKVDRKGKIIYANSQAEEVLGLQKSKITNRTYDDVGWKITYYDGTDYPSEELPFEIVKETEEPVEKVRHAIEWPNGEMRRLSINASPLFDDDGNFDGMVSVIEDVTEQISLQQREDHLTSLIRSIRDVNQLLVKESDRDKLLEGICDILIETRGYHNVWVALLDEDEKLITSSQKGLGDSFQPMLERLEEGNLPATTQKALDQPGVVVTTDPQATCDDCPLSKSYEDRGALTARLGCRGKVYGVISASTPHQYAEDKEEQSLFEEVAGDIGFGLHDMEVEQKRRQALQEISEKEMRLELALEGGNLGTWDWNVETDEVKFNEQWAEMKGYDLEELEPHLSTWEEMVHPDDLPEARKKLNEHLEGKTDYYEAEFRIQQKSGDWVWVLDKGKVIERDEEGNPVRACGTHLDITDRKEAERRLKRYKRGVEASDDSVFMIDKDYRYIFANQEHLSRLAEADIIDGKRNEEVVGERLQEIYQKDSAQLLRENVDQVLDTGKPLTKEWHYKDNKRWTESTYSPVKHPNSKKPREVIVVSKDVTDRKQAEIEAKDRRQELQESFVQLAETTSRVLGVRDPYTQKHELKVGELAREVGKRMGLGEEKLLGLYIGGVLHDIGKIVVPETILTKPGELTDIEWNMIKSHPKVGYNQILEDTKFPWPVAEMTLHHHERLDGSGYPDGLEGDELSTEVRIIGACDVVEAMSTRRPYREARSKERTLNVLEEGKGDKFDPEVVDILISLIEEEVVKFGGS